jgi:GDP-L-fucose synthase
MTYIVIIGLEFNIMKDKNILVTGGSGMVGKSLKKLIPNALYISSKDCDLTNQIEVELLMKTYKPNIIIHLAAKVGGIIDNINNPAEYFDDNILMNTLLLKSAYKYGVERFIGILSTCIYPDKLDTYPMTEDMLHLGPPTPTNFSYGYAKRSLAVQIDVYNKQYGTKYQYLIPCNLYGEYDKYGDNSHFVAALIKKIHNAKINNNSKITLFGTGTPLRQFMHSNDLALIIKKCLDNNIYDNFNVATEENISINDITKIALKACNAEHINIEYDMTKPDGQFRKDVSIDKLKTIIPDFSPTPLFDGIKETYNKINKTILFTN